MTNTTKPRLAVVISHVTQHFAPLYAEIAKHESLELKVFFVAENGIKESIDPQFQTELRWDIPLLDGYDHEFLEPGKVVSEYGFFDIDSRNIGKALRRFSPDFIWVHGYAQMINWRAIFSCSVPAKIIYSSDSNLNDSRSIFRTIIKKAIVRFFLSRCDFFLSISKTNRQYLETYGVQPEKIIDSTFPIDINRFQSARAALPAGSKTSLRKKHSIFDNGFVVLFAGKLIEHKRPQDIIDALNILGEESVFAIFVGSGPLEAELKTVAARMQLNDKVKFSGFVNQTELVQYFDLADIFVFPSEKEPYGAIAAETLSFGLPIVAADGVGAIGKSIIDGDNALLYRSGDVQALAMNIRLLFENMELREEMSKASVSLAGSQDDSHMAGDIVQIINTRVAPK